jgi:tRNA-specific 2-thiouridylase
MQVLVAMSGGVDSSVAAAMLRDEGHEVVGVTLKLWGGDSDSGCCSVSDVDDARRVAQQLDIEHLVFNFGDEFMASVVDPYVADHAAGRTPNPCIECNRHLKFDRLLVRAAALGFDAVATGHHARILRTGSGAPRIGRGVDPAKDQSYVLHMLTAEQLAGVLLPIGGLTKAEVRARAEQLGLRTAGKPDSQDVCFISHAGGGRSRFLGDRIPLRPGRLVSRDGEEVGSVDAVELVTIGQRRGLGLAGDGSPRYALDVDVAAATVTVGHADDLLVAGESIGSFTWVDEDARHHVASGGAVTAQVSAHGEPLGVAGVELHPSPIGGSAAAVCGSVEVVWAERQRRIAPGQSIALYEGDCVLGGGIVR